MRLTILGSGTVDPLAERACSGYFLETESGPVAFEMGGGVVRRADQYGLPLTKVEQIFVSHLHPDHTTDLVTYLFARKYAPPPWNEAVNVTLYGPPGFAQFLERVYAAWPSVRLEPERVSVVEYPERGGEVYRHGCVSVSVLPVEHGDMRAFGFRFTEGHKVLAYSGDTKLCEGVVEVARGADLLLCECSCFPRGCEPLYCREVHMSWEDVAEVCQKAQPGSLLLTHLYKPVVECRPNPQECLSEALNIDVALARDGDVYQV